MTAKRQTVALPCLVRKPVSKALASPATPSLRWRMAPEIAPNGTRPTYKRIPEAGRPLALPPGAPH
jgi:hypothetical protein